MKTERTKQLERLLAHNFNPDKEFFAFECTLGWEGKEIVDCISYDYNRTIKCFEIKQSVSDFHSKAALTFVGDKNYFVMPYDLYEKVKDEIPEDIGCYVSIDRLECVHQGTWMWGQPINGFKELYLIKHAKTRLLRADKEIILSSMIRSMQREMYKDKGTLLYE